MGFDDDLLEGLDDLGDEPFPSDDFEDFPDSLDDDDGGPSSIFLIAGGLIVAAFLILLVVVLLVLSGGGDNSTAQTATSVAATNNAVGTKFAATSTRLAVVNATGTEETRLQNEQGTAESIAFATNQQATIDVQLDGSRTAIAFEATATEEFRLTEVGQQFNGETQTAIALTPTATPMPTLEFVVVDNNGNPIPNCTFIEVYLDDGDGIFNPLPFSATPEPIGVCLEITPPATATPTVTPTASMTNTPQIIPSLTPDGATSGTPEATSDGTTGGSLPPTPTPVEGGAAGYDIEANEGGVVVYTSYVNPAVGNVFFQEAGTPVPTAIPGSGDRLVAVIIAQPDGSFTLSGLPPGNYWLVINGDLVEFAVPDEPAILEIPIDGTPVPVLVFPNIEFPTPPPPPTITPIPTNTVPAEVQAFTQTAEAQQTALASQFPTFQTIVATEATVTPAATDDELPNSGFFDELGEDASPTGLLFLALLGGLMVAAIVIIRRLRTSVG